MAAAFALPDPLQTLNFGLGFHFGALFGVVGELLGIVACLAAIFFVVSGLVMWWQRRPAHAWGVPKAVAGPMWAPFPTALVVMTAILAALMPTFGLTLVAALAVDAVVLRLLAMRARGPLPSDLAASDLQR